MMCARLLTIEGLDPTRRAEVEQRLREQVVPMLRAQHGFAGYIALAGEGGSGRAVVLWDTREDAETAEETLGARRGQMAEEQGFRVTANELYEAPVVELGR